MELSDIPIYVYPIAFILIVILVAAASLLIGRRKFKKANGVAPEIKEKPVKPKGKTLRKSESAQERAENDYRDELDSEEEYKKAIEALRAKPVEKPAPVAAVEQEDEDEQIIEWKPPAEEKPEMKSEPQEQEAAEPEVVEPEEKPEPAVIPVVPIAAVPEPQEENWNDDDLELFEARAYSFDEETQSGYISEKSVNEAPVEIVEPDKDIYAYRDRKPNYDPADDEGVQFLGTKEDERPVSAPEPVANEKRINSKYAYFDSVMEKDKGSSGWKPPEKRAPMPAPEPEKKKTKKQNMQYIELDLDEK